MKELEIADILWMTVPTKPTPLVVIWFTEAPRPNGAVNISCDLSMNRDFSKWADKLSQLERLHDDWDTHSAPKPSQAAILTARGFLTNLAAAQFQPSRLAPSVEGGVGITHRKKNRRAYVEFFNDGQVFVLFSDNETRPYSKQISPGYREFKDLTREIRDYLDVTA